MFPLLVGMVVDIRDAGHDELAYLISGRKNAWVVGLF
jgi:hypothetical protein